MAVNYDLNNTGQEVQERLDQVMPNKSDIEQEVLDRQSGDNALQEQINAINTEIGESGQGGETINGRLDELESAVGSGGSVDERIADAKTEIVGGASEDYDTLGKVEGELVDTYRKNETYSKDQLDSLITTPDVNYVTVIATSGTTDVTTLLPATGATDTIYRVGNWDGTQYDPTVYSLYAWNGSAYVLLAVRTSIGEVYDISVNHPDGQGNPAVYTDLSNALGTNGNNVPADIRHGGMFVKFIQVIPAKYSVAVTETDTQPTGTALSSASSVTSGTYEAAALTDFSTLPSATGFANAVVYYYNNAGTYTVWTITMASAQGSEYVQYRLMTTAWSNTPADWQGVDAEPAAGSRNLVESGGVANKIDNILGREANYTDGKNVNSTGGLNVNSNYGYTHFIPCNEGDTVKWYSGGEAEQGIFLCFYTEESKDGFIAYGQLSPSPRTVTANQGTRFVRGTYYVSGKYDAYCMINGVIVWKAQDSIEGELPKAIDEVRSEIPDITIDAMPTANATETHAASSNGTYDRLISIQKDLSDEITEYTKKNYSIQEGGVFGSSTSYKHGVIPVTKGERYIIENESQDTDTVRYAFVTSDEIPSSTSATPRDIPLATGCSVQAVMHQTKVMAVVEADDAEFLIFNCPDSYQSKVYKYIEGIKEKPAFSSGELLKNVGIAEELGYTDDLVKDKNVSEAIESVAGRVSNYKEDVAINTGGNENASTGWGCTDFIPCAGGVSVKWSPGKDNGGSSTQALVFYDSNKEKLSGYVANNLTRTLTSHEDTAYLRASFFIENSSVVYVQEDGVEVFKPLAGIDSVFKPVFDDIDNRIPVFELIGDNNILVKSVIYGSVKAGHKYRVYVKDRYIDSTGITSSSANTVRFRVSYTTDGENFISLVLVGTNTKANPLKDYYDFELPIITASDPEDPDDVAAANAANAAMSILIGMRATAGAKQVFLLEDITDATDINNLAVQIKDRVFNNDGFISLDLTAKLREFSDLFISTGNEIQSFIFFTDPHIYNLSGDAATNALETYITVIQRYYRNSPTDFVICGGDWLQAGVDRQLSINRLASIDGICRNMIKPYYPLVGNHDLNNVGKEDQEGYKIPQNVLDNLWFRQHGRAYYDWVNGNTRYFAFDTGLDNDHTMSDYRKAQLFWFANELLTNEASHIILCIHIYKYTNFANYEDFVQYLIGTAIAYNAKETAVIKIPRNAQQGSNFDYTNAQGKVHCVIAGHSHRDFCEMNYGLSPSEEAAIDKTADPSLPGIPVVGTVNAWRVPESNVSADTPNFDMMLIDYDNNVLHAVRVGDYGSSRDINLTTGKLIVNE